MKLVAALVVKTCMSLVSPAMLFCTDSHDVALLCDTTDGAADCKTFPELYKSWRQHPELREDFFRKLYGASK